MDKNLDYEKKEEVLVHTFAEDSSVVFSDLKIIGEKNEIFVLSKDGKIYKLENNKLSLLADISFGKTHFENAVSFDFKSEDTKEVFVSYISKDNENSPLALTVSSFCLEGNDDDISKSEIAIFRLSISKETDRTGILKYYSQGKSLIVAVSTSGGLKTQDFENDLRGKIVSIDLVEYKVFLDSTERDYRSRIEQISENYVLGNVETPKNFVCTECDDKFILIEESQITEIDVSNKNVKSKGVSVTSASCGVLWKSVSLMVSSSGTIYESEIGTQSWEMKGYVGANSFIYVSEDNLYFLRALKNHVYKGKLTKTKKKLSKQENKTESNFKIDVLGEILFQGNEKAHAVDENEKISSESIKKEEPVINSKNLELNQNLLKSFDEEDDDDDDDDSEIISGVELIDETKVEKKEILIHETKDEKKMNVIDKPTVLMSSNDKIATPILKEGEMKQKEEVDDDEEKEEEEEKKVHCEIVTSKKTVIKNSFLIEPVLKFGEPRGVGLDKEEILTMFSYARIKQLSMVSRVRGTFEKPLPPKFFVCLINSDGLVYFSRPSETWESSEDDAYEKAKLSYGHSGNENSMKSNEAFELINSGKSKCKRGGVPIYKNFVFAGAIGISGDSPEINEDFALKLISFMKLTPTFSDVLPRVECMKKIGNKSENWAVGRFYRDRAFIYAIYDIKKNVRYCLHDFNNINVINDHQKLKKNSMLCPSCERF